MTHVGNSIYTKEFDDTTEGGIANKFHFEANRTFPLIACKYKVNITLYNPDSIDTHYFYHHND